MTPKLALTVSVLSVALSLYALWLNVRRNRSLQEKIALCEPSRTYGLFIWEGLVTTLLDRPVNELGGWLAVAQRSDFIADAFQREVRWYGLAEGPPDKDLAETLAVQVGSDIGRRVNDGTLHLMYDKPVQAIVAAHFEMYCRE